MPTYTDQQVVAAFNSCLDLAKYASLPQEVKNRFCLLLRHHRVKPVCFMEECGLGLRVFIDCSTVIPCSDEIQEMTYGQENGMQLDLDGHWLRCPPEEWSKEAEKDFIVLSPDVMKVWRKGRVDGDGDPTLDYWSGLSTSARREAVRFTKEEAEQYVRDTLKGEGVVARRGL